MNTVQIEQESYEMPPREGISIAYFLTVADIERSARYYEKVFDARILSLGDGDAPAFLQLPNIWRILTVGGGPTPDKPTVTLSVPDPNHINSFMNFRVADIQACYELWKSRGVGKVWRISPIIALLAMRMTEGQTVYGKGLYPKPPDLRAAGTQNKSDGEL